MRHDSSHAERLRSGSLPVVVKLDERFEVIWTKKHSDSHVTLYSSKPKSDKDKTPWGSVEEIRYEHRENKKGEAGEYIVAKNEFGERTAFKATELNVSIWKMNEWTMDFARIAADNRFELLGKYLSMLVKSEEFRFHDPDLKVPDKDLSSLGGSVEEFQRFLKKAKDSAMRIGGYQDILKELKGVRATEVPGDGVAASQHFKEKICSC